MEAEIRRLSIAGLIRLYVEIGDAIHYTESGKDQNFTDTLEGLHKTIRMETVARGAGTRRGGEDSPGFRGGFEHVSKMFKSKCSTCENWDESCMVDVCNRPSPKKPQPRKATGLLANGPNCEGCEFNKDGACANRYCIKPANIYDEQKQKEEQKVDTKVYTKVADPSKALNVAACSDPNIDHKHVEKIIAAVREQPDSTIGDINVKTGLFGSKIKLLVPFMIEDGLLVANEKIIDGRKFTVYRVKEIPVEPKAESPTTPTSTSEAASEQIVRKTQTSLMKRPRENGVKGRPKINKNDLKRKQKVDQIKQIVAEFSAIGIYASYEKIAGKMGMCTQSVDYYFKTWPGAQRITGK